MSFLVSDVITAARGMFADLPAATGLTLFNAAHAEICRHVKLYPDDFVNVGLTQNQRYYTLDKDVLRVWSAYYYTGATSFLQLREWSSDEGDYKEEGWRGQPASTPWRWFQEGSKIGLDPAPNASSPTLALSGATNATPIVVTSAAHGLLSANDGTALNAVSIAGVGGNANANGSFYGKITGYSPTTMGLYADQDLTIPVAGSGGYTSGGVLVSSASYPIVSLYCQKRRTLATTDTLPLMVDFYDAWRDWTAFLWASERHRDQAPGLYAQAVRALDRLSWKIMGRPARKKPRTSIKVAHIRH